MITESIETEIIKDPEQTGREILYCTLRKDISRMVYEQVQEAIKTEVAKQLETHQGELRLQVSKLISSAISKMNISVPSLTVSLTASESDYDY